jgi:hypothetical protein
MIEQAKRSSERLDDLDPWGTARASVDIAGGPYLFTGMSERQLDSVQRRFRRFLADPCSVPTGGPTIRFMRAPQSRFRFTSEVPEYPLEANADHDRSVLEGLRFRAEISTSPAVQGRVWTSVSGGEEFVGVFENPLRAAVAYRLLEIGGVLLHSAAVLVGDEAIIFFGRSGSGKSTLSKIALRAGHTVLSDDLNTLIGLRGSTVTRAVPFAGEIHSDTGAGEYEVRAILRLEKGDRIVFRRTSRALSIASMLAFSPFVNGDPYRRVTLERNLERVQRSVLPGVLSFPRNADFGAILSAIDGL